MFRIPSGGGSEQAVNTGFGFCTEPSWSPDGNKIAYTVRQGGFSIAFTDLHSGSTRIVASGGEDAIWGPDSRHLLYSNGSSLVLLDAQNGRSFPVVTGLGKVTEPSWSH